MTRLGIDIVFVPRFLEALTQIRFQERTFSYSERLLPDLSLAANYAVKEAFFKAHLIGFNTFDISHLEVLRDNTGAPFLASEDRELVKLITKTMSLSISHDTDYCVGVVLVNRE